MSKTKRKSLTILGGRILVRKFDAMILKNLRRSAKTSRCNETLTNNLDFFYKLEKYFETPRFKLVQKCR